MCNAVAAGIFLAAGLLHLLSESNHLFEELYPDFDIVSPAYLLAAFGFFITFLIDKVLFLKEAPHKNDHLKPPTVYSSQVILLHRPLILEIDLGTHAP